jgi:hypothetical protein
VAPGRLQLGDSLLYISQSSVDQLCHVLARRFAAVSDVETAPDLIEGEARGLQAGRYRRKTPAFSPSIPRRSAS